MHRQQKVFINKDKDYLEFLPLGAAQEVGRSCFYVKFHRASFEAAFMLDCGINPSISEGNIRSEIPALPYFDLIGDDQPPISFILISHYHTDHSMGLPHLIYQLKEKDQLCPIYMSSQTWIEIQKLLKQQHKQDKLLMYLPQEIRSKQAYEIIETIKKQIVIIDQDQTKIDEKTQIKIKALSAGHVEGACMFSLDLNNYKILYTGDFSLEEGRLIPQAKIDEPALYNCDLLITESTCGTISYPSRKEREQRLKQIVEQSLMNGGNCLFPVFGVGIVDELLLMVVDHFIQNLNKFEKCKCVLCGIDLQNIDKLTDTRKQFIERTDKLPDIKPGMVYFAKPAMLQTGTSYELFKNMCKNQMSSLIVTGYASQGSYLYYILEQWKKQSSYITFQDGQNCDLKIKIAEVSFNAHADYGQLQQLVDSYKPKNIILVHGSLEAGQKLLEKLQSLQYNVQQAKLGQIIQFQIEQGIRVQSDQKLVLNQINKFLIDQKGVKVQIRKPVKEQIPLQIGVHYSAKFEQVQKKLEKRFGQSLIAHSNKLSINSNIFDVLFGDFQKFKDFCQNSLQNDENDSFIDILMYQNDKQQRLVQSSKDIFQYLSVRVNVPEQLDYAQKILQIIISKDQRKSDIQMIKQIIGEGEIVDNQLNLQNSIIKQKNGFWIAQGQEISDNLYQILQSINALDL